MTEYIEQPYDEEIEDEDRRTRRWFFLLPFLLLPAMCCLIFFATQLGLLLTRTDALQIQIQPIETANYSLWDYVVFKRLDPALITAVAIDNGTGEDQESFIFAYVPPEFQTNTPENDTESENTDASSDTEVLQTTTPPPSASSDPSSGDDESDTLTPTITLTVSVTDTPTLTETPTATGTVTPTSSETPTSTGTLTETPTATSTLTPTPTLTATWTPTATATGTETPIPPPVAQFTSSVTSGNAPLTVNFTNTSTGTITSYLWNFGDGNTSNATSPSHIFNAAGTYLVTLTATGPGGVATATVTISVAAAPVTDADLSLSMSVSSTSPVEGTSITYTVTLTNNGPLQATNIQVADSLPGGVSFSSFSASQGTYTSGSGAWSVGTVASGATATLTINATVNIGTAGSTINNVANITFADQPDPNSGNNSASVSIVPGASADMQISQTESADPIVLNGTVSYTVTVTNNGPSTASGVSVTQTLSGGTLQSVSGACTGMPCAIGTLASGASANFTVTVLGNTVGTISHTVNVSATGNDPVSGNNSSTQTTTVGSSADVQISQTESADPIAVGGTVNYTVTVTNNGPSAASGVNVTQTLTGGTLQSISGACTAMPCNIGNLASGASTNFTVVVLGNAVGTITHTVNVSAAESDPVGGNNSSMQTTTVGAVADVQISQTESTDPIVLNNTVSYTVTVTNNGPSTATGVNVTQTLTGGTLQSISGACTGMPCNIGTLTNGASANFTVTVLGDTVGTISHSITVSAIENDSTPGNNSSTETTTVGASADVQITQTESADPILLNSTVTYTVTVTNNGPSDASGVAVTQTLTGGTLQSISGACTAMPCNVGILASGASVNFTVVVLGDTVGTISHTVNVAATESDPTPGNNSNTRTTTVSPWADVRISQTESADPIVLNGTVSYVVTVTNNGPSTASSVTVTQTLTGGTLQSVTGDCSGMPCIVGILASGATANFTVTVLGDTVGTISHGVNVSASQIDPMPGNNSSTATTTVGPSADVLISQMESADPIVLNGTVSYTVTVTNNGPSAASGVAVTQTLTGGTLQSIAGACTGMPCNIGALASGASTNFTVTVLGDTVGTISHTVSVSATESDPTPGNNSSTETTIVGASADMQISQTESADPIILNGTVTYTVTVTNNGPSAASGVTVTQTLTGGTLQSVSGACTGLPCNIGSLTSGSSVNFTVVVLGDTVGTISHTVDVSAAEGDPISGNNSSTETTIVGASADMQISQIESADPILRNNTVTYTVTVTNNGPSDASGVTISQTLTGGTLQSVAGDCTGMPCNLGTLTSGASANFTVVVLGDTVGTISHTVDVSATESDPVLGNNSSTATTTVNPSVDVAISQAENADPILLNETVSYAVTVTNNGSSAASGVTITQTLTGGALQSITGDCTGMPCLIGSLAVGASANFTVVVLGDTVGTISHTVDVSATEYDPVPGNNNSTETTTVIESADVRISQLESADPILLTDTVTYTVTVTNDGPSDATGVAVTQTLTGGTLQSIAGACTGMPCNIGALASGASANFTVVVLGDTVGTISHMVNVSATEADPVVGNNSSTETTTVGASADVRISQTESADPILLTDTVTYTVTVTNDGPSNAIGVMVTQMLAGGTLQSITGDCTGMPCNIGALASGASANFTVVVLGDTVGTISHMVSVSATEADPAVGNNSSTETTTVGASADVRISQTESADPISVNNTVTYTVAVTNNGPSDASGVTITQTLTGGILQSITGDCTGMPCNIGALTSGASANFTVVVLGDTVGTISHMVSVSATENDPALGNNSSTETTTVGASADVRISQAESADPMLLNNTVSYTVTVTNDGPSDASGVTITQTLGGGTLQSITGACTGMPCNIGALASGASANFTVTVLGDTVGTITHTVDVSAIETDPTLVNNSSTETTTVNASADIRISQVESGDPILLNNTVNYTVTVTNDGPSTATGVNVTQMLTGGTLQSITGACTAMPCNIGTLASGASANFTVTVLGNAVGTISHTVNVSAAEADPASGNNSSTETTTVIASTDLQISQIESSDPIVLNGTVSYTVTVTNNGPSTATGVNVTHMLTGGTLQSITGACTVMPCNIGTLASGASVSFTVTVLGDSAGTITHTVDVSGLETDSILGNNNSVETTAVGASADVRISQTESADPIFVTNVVVYTVTVTNDGPSDATNVTVNQTLTGGTLQAIGGACGAMPCNLGTLASGASVNIFVDVRADTLGTITHDVNVSATEADLNMGNNASGETTSVIAFTDLSLSVTAPGSIVNGTNFDYTYTITNIGPQDAPGVVLTDILPSQVSFVSSPDCTAVGSDVTCNLGTITNGASVIVTVTAHADVVVASADNDANVSGSVFDPNVGNNSDFTTIAITP